MSKIILLISLAIVCVGQIFPLQAQTSTNQIPLVGLAIHEKHNVPILYAAVYVEHIEAGKPYFNPQNAFRMESRYIIDRFSQRRNHQLWIELAMINNSKEELNNLSTELLQFSKLMKMEMLKGDRLIFDYRPDNGIEVILNGVLIKSFKNNQFQKILTSIWFGNRPPSVVFAQQLNEEPKNKALRAFSKLEYSSQRKSQIDSLYKKPKIAEVAIPQKKAKNEKNVVKKTVKNVKGKTRKPTKIPRVSPQVEAEEPKVAHKLSVLDEVILSLKDEYVKGVKEYIESNARPVPPRRTRKKPNDIATILVTFIETNGKIEIVKSEIVDGEFPLTIQQVLFDSIGKLKQIPNMPVPINEQQLTVAVELDFSKCKRSTSAWLCF